MIRIFPTTLNSHGEHVHPICRYALETLVHYIPDTFSAAESLTESDCVLTCAPACPPYSLNVNLASQIVAMNKPIFVLSDADGYMPDCEGQSPNTTENFQNFIRGGNGIRAYFYREWFTDYTRPDLPFPLLPFELVGYLWNNHPKDKTDYTAGITREQFLGRKWDVLFTQSLNCQSRIALYQALEGFPNCPRRDLYKTGKQPAGDWLSEMLTAKISICLEGAGIKCVSHCEAPNCSVMAMHDIPMIETYPWIHGINCIRLPYDRDKGDGSFLHNLGRGLVNGPGAVAELKKWLSEPEKLWDLARAGFENARRYSLPEYFRNHVGANIVKYL